MSIATIVTLLLAALVLLVRPFTALLHELGHALTALLLTRQKVTVYVGSYGDQRKGLRMNAGLLEIWFRYNFFSWQSGLCVISARDLSVTRQLLIVLAGPLASTLIALTACYLTFALELHGAVKLICLVFLGCALLDLVVNLVPSSTPILLYDGSVAYNDGYRLKQLLLGRRLPKAYDRAVDAYNQGAYAAAARLFTGMLQEGLQDEQAYRAAVSCCLQLGHYEAARELIERFSACYKLNSNDYGNAGLVCSQLGMHEEGLPYFEQSLQLDPTNKYTLHNMAYTLHLLGRYQEAVVLFDKVIEVDVSFANAYSNRGLAKLKCGREGEGLQDIRRSFELEADHAYGYRNLGIYHLDRQAYRDALQQFRKSKLADPGTHLIDDLIKEAETHLAEQEMTA
ncbi:M50 family metallopeptidase [Pontibacter virosus]|uniref:Tetratricopeptide repeat protein n=1 Tax=Pontibacter virosus TaxID=1765052 RepID=A0A2U1AWS6_9BACT|nr:M50 family metallopeptidase [Pontibacter virosus]PVY40858.1 tetratricopeptide repeat protein [Pontibacter virosus]